MHAIFRFKSPIKIEIEFFGWNENKGCFERGYNFDSIKKYIPSIFIFVENSGKYTSMFILKALDNFVSISESVFILQAVTILV